MKQFNAAQWSFIVVVVMGVSYAISTLAIFPLNGIRELKPIWQNWRFSITWEAMQIPVGSAYVALGLSLLAALLIPLALWLQQNKKPALYGDAKFANHRDILHSESIGFNEGIIVGMVQGKLIRYIKDAFVSIAAGTRSGKGATVVITNLLATSMSVIVLDPKKECFRITSKFRQKILRQKVFLFDPFSSETHRYNPLTYIEMGTDKADAQLLGLAEILWPTDMGDGATSHFNGAAQNLFIGLIHTLWTLLHDEKVDSDAREELLKKEVFSISSALHMFLSCQDMEGMIEAVTDINDKAAILLRNYVSKSDDERTSVKSTFENKLKLFMIDTFAAATDASDFDFREMRRDSTTVYFGISAEQMEISPVILNLFFNQSINTQLAENPDFDSSLKYKLLFVLDEFPAIGRVSAIVKRSGIVAGFNLQFLTIFQNRSQIKEIYGEHGTTSLLSAHPCKLIHAPDDHKDAIDYEGMLGTYTPKSRSVSRNSGRASVTESESDTRRPLMMAQELETMPVDEQVIWLKGERPIRCKKPFYFNNAYFINRLKKISPTLAKYGEAFPSKKQLNEAIMKKELQIDIIRTK